MQYQSTEDIRSGLKFIAENDPPRSSLSNSATNLDELQKCCKAIIIVSNNKSYFNDEMHQEAIAKKRGRPTENRWVGQRIDNPEIDICALAKAQGLHSIGPVSDLKHLAEAIEEGLRQVQEGATLVMDVRIKPE